MTVPANSPKAGGFLSSPTGQIIVLVVVLAVVIALAWKYVF